MSFDTTKINQHRQNLKQYDEIWVFGYGSLIYKVDFPYLERRVAYIQDWQRRFWQGSHDHRGTAEKPGRVVTLVKKIGMICSGVAYRVDETVFEHLDHREKNGYLRHEVELVLEARTAKENLASNRKKGLVYIGSPGSEAYLGEASELDIATQISQCIGPSGRNDEYVYKLADGLRALGEVDKHVFAIEKYLVDMARNSDGEQAL